jgi:hypothetical protein
MTVSAGKREMSTEMGWNDVILISIKILSIQWQLNRFNLDPVQQWFLGSAAATCDSIYGGVAGNQQRPYEQS